LLARSVLKVGWRLAMVRGDVEGRMSRLLASLATNSNSSPARLTCKEQFLFVESVPFNTILTKYVTFKNFLDDFGQCFVSASPDLVPDLSLLKNWVTRLIFL
jgi:hypothetical protein